MPVRAASNPTRRRRRRHRRPHRRRIAVVTGSRAEYGLLRSTLTALAADPRVELQVIVTGMHLLPRYGRTAREVTADGWPVVGRVPMQRGDDAALDQAEGLARGVAGVARILEQAQSDLVVVLGDRIEALAGALAATTTGRILAHIHGGDRAPGDFDGLARDAISKLAHLHLAASRRSAQRLRELGESRRRIHVVGAPGLDRLLELRAGRAPEVGNPLQLTPPAPLPPYALVILHPVGRAAELERRAMTKVLSAVAQLGLLRVIIAPNSDRGHSGIRAAIAAHQAQAPHATVAFPSLPRDPFLRLLCDAAVLVGNSSAGLLEAPAAGVPVIDVGFRQRGREPGGRGVQRVAENTAALVRALRQALRGRRPRAGGAATSRAGRSGATYGDGRAGRRIANLLARVPLTESLRCKDE